MLFHDFRGTRGSFSLSKAESIAFDVLKRLEVHHHSLVVAFDGTDLLVSVIALILASKNLVVLPFSPKSPSSIVAGQLSWANVILCSTNRSEDFGGGTLPISSDLQLILLRVPPKSLDADVSHVLFTSASSDVSPKGVLCSRRGISNRCAFFRDAFPLLPGSIVCIPTDFTFVDGFTLLWQCVVDSNIAGVCFLNPISERPWQVLQKHRISQLTLTPSVANAWIAAFPIAKLKESLQYMSLMIFSGEILSWETLLHFKAILPNQCRLLNLYGSTECSGDCLFFTVPSDGKGDGIVPVGRFITGMKGRTGAGSVLTVEGVGVAHGYLEFNGDSFRGDQFVTGDLAKFSDEDGWTILGRADRCAKVRGESVNLAALENAVRSLSFRQSGCRAVFVPPVVGCGSKRRKCVQRLGLLLVTEGAVEFRPLRDKLLQILPAVMVPALSMFLRVETLPLTDRGKIDDEACRRLFWEKNSCAVDSSEVGRLMADVLGLEDWPCELGFFENGGSSLTALELIASLNFAISFDELLKHSTPKKLERYLLTRGEPEESVTAAQGERLESPPAVVPTVPRTCYLSCGSKMPCNWSVDLGKCIDADVLLTGDAMAVVGSHSGDIVGVELVSGNVRWRTTVPTRIEGGAAIFHHLVCFGGHDGILRCLNVATGSLEWSFSAADLIKSTPIVAAGLIWFGSHDQCIYGVDPIRQECVAKVGCGGGVVASPCAVKIGKRVLIVVATLSGWVHCFCFPTMKTQWRIDCAAAVFAAPLAVQGDHSASVIVGTTAGKVYSVDAVTGAIQWASAVVEAPIFAPAVLFFDLLLILDRGGTLTILDRGGNTRARISMEHGIASTPLKLKNGIAIVQTPGKLSLLDQCSLAKGEKRETFSATLPGAVFSSPVAFCWRGVWHIVIGCRDEKLHSVAVEE